MKTKTIEDIEGKLVDIKNSLDAFRKYHRDNATDMNALSYGGESEYSLNGLVCGVRNIVRDLEFLTSRSLKTIFQHKACTVKLYADSFYKVQKNSHSSFEVICCRS